MRKEKEPKPKCLICHKEVRQPEQLRIGLSRTMMMSGTYHADCMRKRGLASKFFAPMSAPLGSFKLLYMTLFWSMAALVGLGLLFSAYDYFINQNAGA